MSAPLVYREGNREGYNMMWYVEAKFDPYGGVNFQKYVGMTKDQAQEIAAKYSNSGWGYVRAGVMSNG